jgi:hypothetical protein
LTSKSINSQTALVLKHLRTSGSISSLEAWDAYGVRSLSRRICDLKERGHNITAETKYHPVTRQRYVRYHLSEGAKAAAA